MVAAILDPRLSPNIADYHYVIRQDLDTIAWHNPQVQGSDSPMGNGATHDLMRSLKR
jgi:hypothetical protein